MKLQTSLLLKLKKRPQPKAIFPFYLPNIETGPLAVYPLSSAVIIPPNDADNLQIEPEVALICDVIYSTSADGTTKIVTALIPRQFGAYNDCSIRKPHAKKISEKKNWGVNSKGISDHLIAIDNFAPGGILDSYRIASFHCRDGETHRYGEDSAVVGYSYFHDDIARLDR